MPDPYGQWVQQQISAFRSELAERENRFAGGIRREVSAHTQRVSKQLEDLAAIARALHIRRGPSTDEIDQEQIVRVEQMPGKRVPYDLIVDIPINRNDTSRRQGSITITQDGPFVAVARYATFRSTHEFQYTDPEDGTTARFSGRSYGRFRPIHSAWDLLDGQSGVRANTSNPLPVPVGSGNLSAMLPGQPELTGSMSGFRTMEFDGLITVVDSGSGLPRQSAPVPTPFWSSAINSVQNLGALDVFERSSVITFEVQPTHSNNAEFGNANGLSIFGTAGWPFLEGQFDRHEGIVTPESVSVATTGAISRIADDPMQRLPTGILTLGFLGYRIFQPTQPVG